MSDWCPQQSSGSWKKWRSTSGAKSGEVKVSCPLEGLKSAGTSLLKTEVASRLVVQFEGKVPAQEDLLILLGMWVSIYVKGVAPEPRSLLSTIAPYMREERVLEWFDSYNRMTVKVKED